MILETLLLEIPVRSFRGNPKQEIAGIAFDSRSVEQGSVFVAVRGTQADGHAFIDKAIDKGAVAIVVETVPAQLPPEIQVIEVVNSQRTLALLAANFYGRPADALTVVGVTGTNGKTSTVTMLYQLFQAMGRKAGLISTVNNRIGEQVLAATHTTPDPIRLHQLFAQMLAEGCRYCFMEVSSHALVQERVAGIPFRLGLFTNITHDHLDYHGTFKAYIQAKKLLFDELGPDAVALVNADDRQAGIMLQNTKATKKTFALKRMADYRVKLIENTFEGLLLEIAGVQAWFRLCGSFNAYNLLLVYAAACELGMDPEEVLRLLSQVKGAEGRFQLLRSEMGHTAIVDYAHTPDALENVLNTVADVNQTRGRVITVVGCGGNRDKEKRPKMAKIAAEKSDQVILTSDNPRDEEPAAILQDMYAGVPLSLRKKVLQIENRKEAIRTGCAFANPEDIVLVAGKGHETYQEIRGHKYPFDDREVLRSIFEEWKNTHI